MHFFSVVPKKKIVYECIDDQSREVKNNKWREKKLSTIKTQVIHSHLNLPLTLLFWL